MSPLLIGSLGVALLLIAFVLNLIRVLHESGPVYLLMNLVGAAAACWYAWVSGIVPFVVLEAAWGLTALVRLIAGTWRPKGQENPRPVAGG